MKIIRTVFSLLAEIVSIHAPEDAAQAAKALGSVVRGAGSAATSP